MLAQSTCKYNTAPMQSPAASGVPAAPALALASCLLGSGCLSLLLAAGLPTSLWSMAPLGRSSAAPLPAHTAALHAVGHQRLVGVGTSGPADLALRARSPIAPTATTDDERIPLEPVGFASAVGIVAGILFLPLVAFLLRGGRSGQPAAAATTSSPPSGAATPTTAPAGSAKAPKSLDGNLVQHVSMASVMAATVEQAEDVGSLLTLKRRILQLAALTDRGQRHQKLVSDAMADRAEAMQALIKELSEKHPSHITEQTVAGKWELVYSSVELFRSSPFFLAIEQAFNDKAKSDLFFKLHLLQVGSWGVSTIGEVSQQIDFDSKTLRSDFDTTLFGLTVIPIVGWFKLLPTFGGRVVTEAKDLRLEGDRLTMELDRTRVQDAPGIPFMPLVGGAVKDRWVPVNAVWQLLPWNQDKPTCSVRLLYVDDDLRVVEDEAGGLFIYMRPAVP